MNAQHAFTQQTRQQSLHTEIAKLFIDQQPLDITIERLGQLLCKQLELCTVALYTQGSSNSAVMNHHYTLVNTPSGNSRLHWQHGFLDWYEQLENDQTVLIDIERCDHHRAQFLRSLNINSGVLCPMRVNSQWAGFLLFGSKDKDSLKHRYNVDLLNDISEMCSARLGAQQQSDQRQQSLQRVQALERITQSFNRNAVDSVSIERAVTEVRETFDADRAWLLNPELIDEKHVEVAYEVSAPEWPGSKTLNEPLEIDEEITSNIALLESRDLPITFGSGNEHPLPRIATRYGVQSQVVMLLRPSTGDPWVLGLDHCRSKRYWSNNEQLLFKDIGNRITEHLSQNLLLQQVADSENKFRTLFNETPSIFVTLNKNHRLTSINRYGINCLKTESARLKGKLFYELFDDEYRDAVLTYLEWANNGSATNGADLQST
ncbi:MAG: GAF domain-containing protein, partial [Gammaproteobacteria bacterium]|nr:GAF domain-containing protein [Gammaproteobacteria bacterium]